MMSTNSLDLSKANVLITGGSEGIGRGLAERFLKAGSSVFITGRNPAKLKRAVSDLPGLRTLVNDISSRRTESGLLTTFSLAFRTSTSSSITPESRGESR
jgi:short-subunit dehydrogenase involved in D-alanine esterification of teichoic acids